MLCVCLSCCKMGAPHFGLISTLWYAIFLTTMSYICYITMFESIAISTELVTLSHASTVEENTSMQLNSRATYPELLREPSANYPKYSALLDVLTSWNPDIPEPPQLFNEVLQHFNFSCPDERLAAEKFRDAEVPFKLYDVPDFNRVSRLWSDEYLESKMSRQTPHVEKSETNHFMYWNMRGPRDRSYRPPTTVVNMKFKDWLRTAKAADKNKIFNATSYYYFMTGSSAGDQGSSFVAKDLSALSTKKNNFFIVDVNANKGIQCRFGMRGIIAEAHYDSGRNMVAMIRGAKRYILTPPSSCKQLGIITDIKHPSYRHSVIDWSDLTQATSRGFDKVQAIDTILREGEVLYIPSYWFHYITSLSYSIQCNSRSGSPPGGQGKKDIEDCMGRAFGDKSRKKSRRRNPKLRANMS